MSGKLRTEFTNPRAKSTSPRLSDMTFFARCKWAMCVLNRVRFEGLGGTPLYIQTCTDCMYRSGDKRVQLLHWFLYNLDVLFACQHIYYIFNIGDCYYFWTTTIQWNLDFFLTFAREMKLLGSKYWKNIGFYAKIVQTTPLRLFRESLRLQKFLDDNREPLLLQKFSVTNTVLSLPFSQPNTIYVNCKRCKP